MFTKKYYLSAIFLIIIFSASISICAADVNSIINEGDQFYKNFENLKALEKYKQAYQLDSTNYEALSKLTRIFNDVSGEYKLQWKKEVSEKYAHVAVKYAEIFHNKYPDSALTYTYRAMAYGGLAKLVGSKEKIKLANSVEQNAKKAIQLNSNDFLPYLILGIYYREIARSKLD